MIRKLLICALVSSATTPAFAQDQALLDEAADDGDAIVVTGRAAQLYRAGETSSGKLPTEPLASSQAISIITEELIDDQGARDAQDLYRNISGVSVFSYAGVTARGFRQQENFYDGLRGDPYIGFSVPQLFNISRVEFLKGPAGMLYGQTAPGGLFNYVTKKPTKDFEGKVALVGGAENRYGAQTEVSGPVNDVISVRAGAFFENRDTPRFNSGNKATVLDAGVALDFDVARFTVQALHISQDLDGNRLRGVPVNNAGEFLASRRWNHNEPGDFLDLRSTSVQAKVELDITSNLKIDAAVRRIDASETQKYHEPNGLVDTNADAVPDLVPRQYRDQFRDNSVWSFGTNAVWAAQLGANISNRFLAGFDQSSSILLFDGRSLSGRNVDTAGLPCPISLPNPVYGRCDPATYNLPAFARTITGSERRGFYALNELTVGKLIGVLGIRTDSFEDVAGATRFKGSDESYRVGLVYRATDDISLFGQYATSFEPQSAASQDPRAGGPFDPTTGDIIEGGIKTALMNGRVQSTIAVYRIKRQNILQSDPLGDPENDGINNSVQFGEVTSKGVDVDIAADITPNWVLTLTYAYNDTRITKDNGRTPITNSVIGGRFANAPKHKLGFWTRYDLPLTGLAVAIGGDYVSERISLSNQTIKPYFVFDGSLTYETGPWKFLARIDNIFDKTYASSGFNDRGGHFPGEPRSAFLEASYRF